MAGAAWSRRKNRDNRIHRVREQPCRTNHTYREKEPSSHWHERVSVGQGFLMAVTVGKRTLPLAG